MIASAASPEMRLLLFSAGLIALVSMVLLLSRWRKDSPLYQWTLLRPVDAEPEDGPERDNMTIERIREAGADMSAVHRVDFFLIFKSREAAEQAKAELDGDYEVAVSQAVNGQTWCTATTEMLIYLSLIRGHADRMTALASKLGGKYDGWGTSLEQVSAQRDDEDDQ